MTQSPSGVFVKRCIRGFQLLKGPRIATWCALAAAAHGNRNVTGTVWVATAHLAVWNANGTFRSVARRGEKAMTYTFTMARIGRDLYSERLCAWLPGGADMIRAGSSRWKTICGRGGPSGCASCRRRRRWWSGRALCGRPIRVGTRRNWWSCCIARPSPLRLHGGAGAAAAESQGAAARTSPPSAGRAAGDGGPMRSGGPPAIPSGSPGIWCRSSRPPSRRVLAGAHRASLSQAGREANALMTSVHRPCCLKISGYRR
jgi:hypothetical protein